MASTINLVAEYSVKPAGVYRQFIDATITARATTSKNVVIVIQSEQGPIMKPILVNDATELHTVFGNRNAKLEAKGNFGILMAEHVLELGRPVWILNIKNINANVETLQVVKLACNSADTEELADETISAVYDTTKFWNIDKMYGAYGDGPVLSFASVLGETVTVVVTKYIDADRNYAYTVADTKKMNESFLGEGLDDDALVSDYLIQVDVFKTNLLNAALNVPGAIVNGRINLSKLADLRADANAKHYATYKGSVGSVIDLAGNSLSIATQMNADYLATGVWCAINADQVAAHGVDLMGRDAFIFDQSGAALPTVAEITRLGETVTPETETASVKLDTEAPTIAYAYGDTPLKEGDVVANEEIAARVKDVQYIGDELSIDQASIGTAQAPVMVDGKPFGKNTAGTAVYPATSPKAGQPVEYDLAGHALHYANAYVEHLASWVFNNVIYTAGDSASIQMIVNGVASVIELEGENLEQLTTDLITKLNLANAGTFTAAFAEVEEALTLTIEATAIEQGIQSVKFGYLMVATDMTNPAEDNEAYHRLEPAATAIIYANGKVTCEGITPAGGVDVDMDAVKAAYGNTTMIRRITFDHLMACAAQTEPVQTVDILGEQHTVKSISILRMRPWYDQVTTVASHVIRGIKSLESHYVNGTAARQSAILDMLNTAGITNSFADPTIFKCRYMVDTFVAYIEPNAKHQYATLAKNSMRFLVFASVPFVYRLRASKNPDFHDLLGQFDMSYVKAGKNPNKPSTNSYYFTNDIDGAKYIVPCPGVEYNDGFATKIIPSTGIVAKAYYSKHFGQHKVYDIVAGMDYPLSGAGVVGPEFNPSQPERAAMEAMGMNVIQTIEQNNQTSIQLRSSLTAYQTVQSAFNAPETMEKCLYVSDMVEPMLDGKLFKYNNDDTRLAIKLRADEVCDQMVADGVITTYKNTCDLSNNTTDVRRAGILVLDTEFFNEFGIRVAVHRTTVKVDESNE